MKVPSITLSQLRDTRRLKALLRAGKTVELRERAHHSCDAGKGLCYGIQRFWTFDERQAKLAKGQAMKLPWGTLFCPNVPSPDIPIAKILFCALVMPLIKRISVIRRIGSYGVMSRRQLIYVIDCELITYGAHATIRS